MRPGRKSLVALAVLGTAALLVPLEPMLVWALFPALAAVLVLAVAERILLGRVRIAEELQPAIALSLDEEEEISFRLTTDATRTVHLVARQMWPELFSRMSTTMRGSCRPGEVLALDARVRGIRRGTRPLVGLHVAAWFWGWSERIVPLEHGGEISVIPNLRAVRRMHKKLNSYVLRGLGQRRTPRIGKGREFDRLREYNQNDDFRDIAWKASARHGKLIVREYRLDRSQDVLLCLDRGHRMAALTTRIRRVDHAVNAAVLISYICNRMEDRVGALTFGAAVDPGIPQGKGAAHLRQITAFATGVRAEYIHTDYLALAAHVRRRLRRRSLILIVTTLPERGDQFALVRAVGMLAPQHLPLVIVLADPALKAAAHSLPADKEELCRTLVARDVWTERRRMVNELRRRGAWVVETPPEDAGIDSVNAYIEIKQRQLI